MELAVSPDRKLYIDSPKDQDARELAKLLRLDLGRAILALASACGPRVASASCSFWSEFGRAFLRSFCAIADEFASSVVAVDPTIIARFSANVPNILGAEYIDADYLRDVWAALSAHIVTELEDFSGSPRRFLEQNYPDWAGVGRVYFHLAENTADSAKPFAFLASYTTRVSDRARLQHAPLGSILKQSAQKTNTEQLLSILRPIKEAAAQSELIKGLVDSKKIYGPLFLSTSEAYRLLGDIPVLERAGIIVKLPQWWQGKPPARAKVTVQIGDAKKGSFVGLKALFKLQVSVTVAGETLNEEQVANILAQNQQLIKINGRWIEVNPDKLKGILAKWQKAQLLDQGGVSFIEAMRMLSRSSITKSEKQVTDSDAGSWLDFTAGKGLADLLQSMQSPAEIVNNAIEPVLSNSLKATLRPYQYHGVKWLALISRLALGGCLADDMGLGKTLQIIALLLLERAANPGKASLIVVPASLLGNWESEIQKFAPSLKYKILHSAHASQTEITAFAPQVEQFDAIITTYKLCTSIAWLKETNWNLVVLDEAQAIKNPAAMQSKAIKQLRSRASIALTGTPIENNLTDLWSLYDFSCPGLLGSYAEFKSFHKDLQSSNSYTPLRKLIGPYLLRRKKTDKDIVKDLPAKTELKTFCLLSKEQIKLYRKTIAEMARALDADNSDIKRKGVILGYLLKFKQICNHPSQLHGDGDYEYSKSGKLLRLREIAEAVAARGEKLLVFTQFRELTDILAAFLAEIFGKKGHVLHGGTSVKKRQQLVEEFQSDENIPYFVLSLKAGGTGLNLTKASHVLHFDRWWNPAVENQATDRAFRIGQKRNVVVHKFICRGTIEERIDLMIADKSSLAKDVIETNATKQLTELSNAELMDLVAIDVNSAQLNE